MKKIRNRLAKFLSLLCCSCMIFAGSACDSAARQSEDNTPKTDIADTPIDLTGKDDPLVDKTAPEGETEKKDEESPADKTDPEEESPKKDGEDSEEEEKGEQKPTVTPDDSTVTFRDVGEEFQIVAKPLYDAAETILNDLIADGKVSLSREHNPRIVAIRYFYGHSFQINIRQDIYVNLAGDVSEFLQQEYGYSLENFGDSGANAGKDEGYAAYNDFLHVERSSQNDPNYVAKVLPYAEKSAALILKGFRSYKESERFELKTLNFGKQLILRKDSSLSKAYEKIVENLNGVLSKRGYPLLTDQDLDIGFGSSPLVAAYDRWIIIEAHIGSLRYAFYISFNENEEVPQATINYFEGTMMMGYTPSNPDALNPPNEEYAEFFALLGIDKIDLSDIRDSYKYDGVGSALYKPDGETTHLYF